MKAVLITAFIVIAAVLALALSCPDEQSFDRWIEKTSHNESDSLMAQAGDKVLSTQEQLTAKYDTKVLWASVETRHGMAKARYIGLFGMWFEIAEK